MRLRRVELNNRLPHLPHRNIPLSKYRRGGRRPVSFFVSKCCSTPGRSSSLMIAGQIAFATTSPLCERNPAIRGDVNVAFNVVVRHGLPCTGRDPCLVQTTRKRAQRLTSQQPCHQVPNHHRFGLDDRHPIGLVTERPGSGWHAANPAPPSPGSSAGYVCSWSRTRSPRLQP